MTHVSDPVDSPETILFDCSCGQPMRISSKCAGKAISCPKCGTSVVVPPSIPAEGETKSELRDYTLFYLYGGVDTVAVAAAFFLFLFIRSTDESRKEQAQAAVSQATANATQWLESGDVDEAGGVEDALISALANPDVGDKQAGERALANVRERRAELAAEKILANARRQLQERNFDRAISLLDKYRENSYATNVAAAKSLREQVDAAKADERKRQLQQAADKVFAHAKRQLEARKLESAAKLLDEYIANSHATEATEAKSLRQQVDAATSDDLTLSTLVQLNETEFDRAKSSGVIQDRKITHAVLVAVRKETIERNIERAVQRRDENRIRRKEFRIAVEERRTQAIVADAMRRAVEQVATSERKPERRKRAAVRAAIAARRHDPFVQLILGKELSNYNEHGFKGVALLTPFVEINKSTPLRIPNRNAPCTYFNEEGDRFLFDTEQRLVCYVKVYQGLPDEYIGNIIEVFGKTNRAAKTLELRGNGYVNVENTVTYLFPRIYVYVHLRERKLHHDGEVFVIVCDREWLEAVLFNTVNEQKKLVSWMKGLASKIDAGSDLNKISIPVLENCMHQREEVKGITFAIRTLAKSRQGLAAAWGRSDLAIVGEAGMVGGVGSNPRLHRTYVELRLRNYPEAGVIAIHGQEESIADGVGKYRMNALKVSPLHMLLVDLNCAVLQHSFPSRTGKTTDVTSSSLLSKGRPSRREWETRDGWSVYYGFDGTFGIEKITGMRKRKL